MRFSYELAAAMSPRGSREMFVFTGSARSIASMAAAMEGMDVLVFTGGVGEHSHEIRGRAAAGLGFLGVAVEDARNREMQGEGEMGAHGAQVRTLVLTAREDIEIAGQVRAVLAGQ